MRYSIGGVFHIVSRGGKGWFRMFGIGISWKDTRKHGLMFSERYGHQSGMQISKWRLHFLSQEKDLTNSTE